MNIFWVTVESEDEFEGEWIDNLIVVADDIDDAKALAEAEVKERDSMRIDIEAKDIYELNTDTARVVGKLVPDDEW